MKRVVLLLAVLVVVALITGCAGGDGGSTPPPPSPVPNGDQPPVDRTWISPGKVVVSNFYPGARAEYPITVHNGNDYPTTFAVTYRYPDHVEEDYDFPPTECQDWVIIADHSPVIAPYGTEDILVALDMPKGADAPDEWEFWVSVMDASQTGFVRTELCTRWLIDMR